MELELSEQAKALKRKYHREWQRNNKEKVRNYKVRYWEKKAKELQGKANDN